MVSDGEMMEAMLVTSEPDLTGPEVIGHKLRLKTGNLEGDLAIIRRNTTHVSTSTIKLDEHLLAWQPYNSPHNTDGTNGPVERSQSWLHGAIKGGQRPLTPDVQV